MTVVESNDDLLTMQERQTLAAYRTGMTYAEVAVTMYVSLDTMKVHMAKIRKKLCVHKTSLAVDLACRLGLLDGLPSVPARSTPLRKRKPARRVRPLVSPQVAIDYPSTLWGEEFWCKLLKADTDLFNGILRGMSRIPVQRTVNLSRLEMTS